ncbi:MAG TPA: DNA primase, partial [Treponema sp.]|nr:DNA primase [Treponema sp.]
MASITQESIDEVSSRTDIVRLIGEYVPLTQRGNDWWGCCPFHNEKTPSFSVSPDKKFYYCFGCHASGTAFKFIQEMEKLSFPEAVEFLAKKAGVELHYSEGGGPEHKDDSKTKLRNEYIDLYSRVATTFHYMLMETEAGRFARDYITKRGLTNETLEKFKIGYSPADRKWLRSFLEKKNYSAEFLNNSGLFSKKYPEVAFFSDRLMFPIFDRKGDVVAMGGRFLRGDKDKSPKYLNSGDLIQYKKGNTLYAFNFAKQAIRENKKVILCEGYMDCIAYHQCGINYAVAPLGTALTEEQVALVKPFVDTVYLSFDSDGAGQNATKKAILMCRRHSLTVKIIRLDGGKDPAEIMLNFGKEYLTKQVDCAILDNDYLLSKLQEVYPKDNPEGKAKASLVFFAYIDALQSDVQKNACLEQLCQTYDIDQEAARKDFYNREQLSQRFKRNVNTVQENRAEFPTIKLNAELRAVLTAVTDDASLFQKMRDEISVQDLEDPWAIKLFSVMEECLSSGS